MHFSLHSGDNNVLPIMTYFERGGGGFGKMVEINEESIIKFYCFCMGLKVDINMKPKQFFSN